MEIVLRVQRLHSSELQDPKGNVFLCEGELVQSIPNWSNVWPESQGEPWLERAWVPRPVGSILRFKSRLPWGRIDIVSAGEHGIIDFHFGYCFLKQLPFVFAIACVLGGLQIFGVINSDWVWFTKVAWSDSIPEAQPCHVWALQGSNLRCVLHQKDFQGSQEDDRFGCYY